MSHAMFEKPVQVIVGFGVPSSIESVLEAYALLNDWPLAQRKAEHSVALKACRAALAGEIDAETARATFVAFARRNDLLAPETDGTLAAPAMGSSPAAAIHP